MGKKGNTSKPITMNGIYYIDDSFTIPPEIQAMSHEEIRAKIKEYKDRFERERIAKEKNKVKDSKS